MTAKAPGWQRIRHVDGERLRACDLDVDAAHEAGMLARHVRALHATWGVALGYEVGIAASGTALVVGPGLAYDGLGRSVVSSRPVLVPLPAAASPRWFDLVVRLAREAARPTGCLPRPADGVPPGEERPDFRCVDAGGPSGASGGPPPLAGAIRLGLEIPLARVLLPSSAGAVPDLSTRQIARPIARARVVGGVVNPGEVPISGMPLEWSATIDTSGGDFGGDQPVYFATLADDPYGANSLFAGLLLATTAAQRRRLLGPLVTTSDPGPTGFTLRVRMAAVDASELDGLPAGWWDTAVSRVPVAVRWIGIESVDGQAGLNK